MVESNIEKKAVELIQSLIQIWKWTSNLKLSKPSFKSFIYTTLHNLQKIKSKLNFVICEIARSTDPNNCRDSKNDCDTNNNCTDFQVIFLSISQSFAFGYYFLKETMNYSKLVP